MTQKHFPDYVSVFHDDNILPHTATVIQEHQLIDQNIFEPVLEGVE